MTLLTFLDDAFKPLLGKPFERGFVGRAAGVLVDYGGVDYVWVGHFKALEVGF